MRRRGARLTVGEAPGCCWCLPASRWSWGRGWRGSEGTSSPRSSPGHTAWPCPTGCLPHALPPLKGTVWKCNMRNIMMLKDWCSTEHLQFSFSTSCSVFLWVEKYFRQFFLSYVLICAKATIGSSWQTESTKLTIDRSLSWQDDDDELQSGVRVLQVSEHGLHAVRSLGVFTETRLALDGHPSILRDFTQLVSETSTWGGGKQEGWRLIRMINSASLCLFLLAKSKHENH